MAYATTEAAFEAGAKIYGAIGRVCVKPVEGGFCYEPLFNNQPLRGVSAFDSRNLPEEKHAVAVDNLPANNKPVAIDSALDSSTMDELCLIMLNDIIKRAKKRAIANDDADAENRTQFGCDNDVYQKQYEATKAHYAGIHQRQSESAKRQSEAAKNRFIRK